MKFKRFKKDYLIFSKKERNASIVLTILIAVSISYPAIDNSFRSTQQQTNYSELSSLFVITNSEATSKIEIENKYEPDFEYDYVQKIDQPVSRTLFYFDPNEITSHDWQAMGVPGYISERVIKFLQAGGNFEKKEDVLKIYGFRQSDYDAIESFMRIDSVQHKMLPANTAFLLNPDAQIIEINSATTEELISIGFNTALSARIIKFRDAIGGIYSLDQLHKVYSLEEEDLLAASEFITIDKNKIRQINLNTCSFEELESHSYISEELANSIIEYRTTSGRFVSVSEVAKVKGMYASLFEKLKPYLRI